VRPQVIHDHEVSGAKRRGENLFQIGSEHEGVCRALQSQTSRLAVETDRRDHGGCAPMTLWGMGMQPGSSKRAAPEAGHVRLRA